MSPEEARSWVTLKASMYRYLNCDTDFTDEESVRQANIESENYVRHTAPNLFKAMEVGNVVRAG